VSVTVDNAPVANITNPVNGSTTAPKSTATIKATAPATGRRACRLRGMIFVDTLQASA
jgi:hypothetical protein